MKKILCLLFMLLSLVSCASTTKNINSEKNNYHLRIYKNIQYKQIVSSCIATMQDLGFVILSFDTNNGKLEGYTDIYPSKMIIDILQREKYISVMLQAKTIETEYKKSNDINDEIVYENFFKLLDANLEL